MLLKKLSSHQSVYPQDNRRNSIDYVVSFFQFCNKKEDIHNFRTGKDEERKLVFLTVENEQVYVNTYGYSTNLDNKMIERIVKFKIFDKDVPIPMNFSDKEREELLELREGFLQNLTGVYFHYYFQMIKRIIHFNQTHNGRVYFSLLENLPIPKNTNRIWAPQNKTLFEAVNSITDNSTICRIQYSKDDSKVSSETDCYLKITGNTLEVYNHQDQLVKTSTIDIKNKQQVDYFEGVIDKKILNIPSLDRILSNSRDYLQGYDADE